MVQTLLGRDAGERRDALILLAHAAEPGEASVASVLARWGPVDLLARIRAGRTGLRHGEGLAARLQGIELPAVRDRADRVGARILTREDAEWPSQLDDLGSRAPLALWVVGAAHARLAAMRSVAIVGARACTAYGEEVTRSWSSELAAAGWCVVSGAAFGIDAAAHRGALAGRGITVAVMAGGVDVPYPRAHTALLSAIADQGLIISEVPPGQAVRRQRFLSRNRVIAAISRATVVVEAAQRSGTAATAREAAGMSRPVLAVPGPVTSVASHGCHLMVQDGGATLATHWTDVLAAVDLDAAGRADALGGRGTARDTLAEREARLLDALPSRGLLDLAALVRSSGLAMRDVLAGMGVLAAGGWVAEEAAGWRRLRVPDGAAVPDLRR